MKKAFLVLLAFLFGAVMMVLQHQGTAIIPEAGLLIAFLTMVKYKHNIAKIFDFKRAPELLLIIIALFPFMMFEENINCFPPEQGGCKLFPMTYPFLIIETLILYWIAKRRKVKKAWPIVSIASFLGVLWEITVGVSAAAFLALPPLVFSLIFAWTWMSYAFIFLIPITLYVDRAKRALPQKE